MDQRSLIERHIGICYSVVPAIPQGVWSIVVLFTKVFEHTCVCQQFCALPSKASFGYSVPGSVSSSFRAYRTLAG